MRVILDQTEELSHYGVQGMKWGVRRTPEELGHAPASKRNARQHRITLNNASYYKGAGEINKREAQKRIDKLKNKGVPDDSKRMQKHQKKLSDANAMIKRANSAIAAYEKSARGQGV